MTDWPGHLFPSRGPHGSLLARPNDFARACPSCHIGDGRIQSVTAHDGQRTIGYVCNQCQHTWVQTMDAVPGLFATQPHAPKNLRGPARNHRCRILDGTVEPCPFDSADRGQSSRKKEVADWLVQKGHRTAEARVSVVDGVDRRTANRHRSGGDLVAGVSHPRGVQICSITSSNAAANISSDSAGVICR